MMINLLSILPLFVLVGFDYVAWIALREVLR